ncbi:hypothetical protein FA15DRAFT_694509 [Coprinopsis marcescibilis]|uniref:Uncharacterized protein n=1 Tax=Coprinopsis marcescibilis TaxID=230819 RepID=A0A5C3KV93_COPMA|nr:hypothetical protein FA15DRAFT_694509 [Coprinopsis marcescibilis]
MKAAFIVSVSAVTLSAVLPSIAAPIQSSEDSLVERSPEPFLPLLFRAGAGVVNAISNRRRKRDLEDADLFEREVYDSVDLAEREPFFLPALAGWVAGKFITKKKKDNKKKEEKVEERDYDYILEDVILRDFYDFELDDISTRELEAMLDELD